VGVGTAKVAGESVARDAAASKVGGTKALAFTGGPTAFLSALGATLVGLGLLVRRLAGIG
jgi:hypothetical protein